MVKEYTEIWNGFQFRSPVYIDGHFEPNKYDLVKWVEHEPEEIWDLSAGKKRMSTRHCFSVGFLVWDPKEPGFEFESCGLRYLEHRIDGLEQFILDFAEKMEAKYMKERDEYGWDHDYEENEETRREQIKGDSSHE